MIPAISQCTTLAAPFKEELEQYAGCRMNHVEIWLPKLEAWLKNETIQTTKKLFSDLGIVPVAGSIQGGLLRPQGEARKAHEDHYKKRLEIMQDLGIPQVVIVPETDHDSADLGPVAEGLVRAAQWAEAFGIKVALEFSCRARVVNNLQTAAMLIRHAAQPNLALCLDLFHFWNGPSKESDLDLLTEIPFGLVQVSDISGICRELATDGQRILPGEGDIPLKSLLAKIKQSGYQGPVSVELLNPQIWGIKPSHVAELAQSALMRLV